jgi:hypothetical protein
MTTQGFIDGSKARRRLLAALLVAVLCGGCASGGGAAPAPAGNASAVPFYLAITQGLVTELHLTLTAAEAAGTITGARAKSADKAFADAEAVLSAASVAYAAYQAGTSTKATTQQQIQAVGGAVSVLITAVQQAGLLKAQDAMRGQELLALAVALSQVTLP